MDVFIFRKFFPDVIFTTEVLSCVPPCQPPYSKENIGCVGRQPCLNKYTLEYKSLFSHVYHTVLQHFILDKKQTVDAGPSCIIDCHYLTTSGPPHIHHNSEGVQNIISLSFISFHVRSSHFKIALHQSQHFIRLRLSTL